MTRPRHECPHCGKIPFYHGRKELLRHIKHWHETLSKLLSDPARNTDELSALLRYSGALVSGTDVIAQDMGRVLAETEKTCVYCDIP